MRLAGEEKSVFTVWLLIGQHTLHHETFVMPAPIENHAEFYAHLLRRNHTLRGLAFTIGAEDAVFLEGRIPLDGLDDGRPRRSHRDARRGGRTLLPSCHADRLAIDVPWLTDDLMSFC